MKKNEQWIITHNRTDGSNEHREHANELNTKIKKLNMRQNMRERVGKQNKSTVSRTRGERNQT